MLKAILIDDEINGVEVLKHLINDNCPGLEILASETSAQKGIELIKKHKPDVVFLDIEMPEMSGFELLEKVQHLAFHVIFTTAYDAYALRAFKYNTVDYLLKPIIVGELVAAVNKMASRTSSQNAHISDLLKTLQHTTTKEKLAINSQNEIVYVDIADILRLESDSNYTHFILKNHKKITSSKTMKEYESILDGGTFFRAHKTFIVNLNYIEKFVKSEGGYIVMKDEVQIPVSRERRQELVNILAER
jgi:two-component system LytT family response regulator